MPPREHPSNVRSGPSNSGGSPYRGPGYEADPLASDLVIEFPASRPSNRRAKGVSAVGAFFIALLAQISLVGIIAAAAIAFPAETSLMVSHLRMHFAGRAVDRQPTSEVSAATLVPTDRRLEILRLEDRAISRKDRGAWNLLQEKVAQVPVSHPDYEAIQASLIRIRLAYDRPELAEPPALDPREVFPTAATEADIPLASLIQLLHDSKQSESKRQRCAYLLKRDNSPVARNALFQSIQEDPSLLVIHEAFESFQILTGYPGKNCFDAPGVARWWSRNAHGALGQK